MKRDAVEEFVSGVVETIIESTELELVDVEYVHEREWYLRVFLDKEGGIDLDDCQMVSEKLSEVLDAKDFVLQTLKEGDLFVTIGAGDNWQLAKKVLSQLENSLGKTLVRH